MMNKSVLYVDDEPMNLLLFSKLIGAKYEVITAISGIDALEALHKKPDIKLVFSDLKMPEMNGVEFISKAKKSFDDKLYYIISGYELNNDIKKAIETGLITDYLKKPFNLDIIFKTIEKAFT
ncbi:response regulator [Carboxylicivirga linearis]|uniref:Response regulator n=1 Tax=Carboxylicivirga linearis TaxID=1628157 RepID=A0ABS5JRJ6_9BACT|nr:response regulator [Carboxylicivirga linearis]MBS2097518.1 response regulator [Carboxylicivirga linearis]